MAFRANARVRVRNQAQFNEGKLGDGTPWSNWTFEGVDSDDNKVTFRLADQHQGSALKIGEHVDITADCSVVSGKPRYTVVSVQPVKG